MNERRPANLSRDQIREALPKLRRRLEDLRAVDVAALTEADADNVLAAVKRKVNMTLVDLFGHDSLEFQQFEIGTLDRTPLNMVTGRAPIEHRRPTIRRGLDEAINTIRSAIEIYEERLEDVGETGVARALRAYEGLQLHPSIAAAASTLYRDGHYANAVEAAVKALNALVRERSGMEQDGSTLMERAFGGKTPVLRFNGLSDQSDADEQRGFMMMFSGAVAGLRNPRAHGFVHDKPERALEFIAFVSLLAKLLDESAGPIS